MTNRWPRGFRKLGWTLTKLPRETIPRHEDSSSSGNSPILGVLESRGNINPVQTDSGLIVWVGEVVGLVVGRVATERRGGNADGAPETRNFDP